MSQPSFKAPLSYAQERLWILSQIEPESTAYSLRAAYRLEGRLDAAVLATALEDVVRRHEILRTTFAEEGGSPVQVVHPAGPIEIPLVDLSRESREVARERLVSLSRERLRVPFDLTTAPLLRPVLYRLGEEEHVLLLLFHHIVFDGWSGGVLIEELLEAYEMLAGGAQPALPPPPRQYSEFARWQRRHLESGVIDSQLDYWRRQLAGAPLFLDLPTDRPRSEARGSLGAVEKAELDDSLAEAVRNSSLREGVTPFMTMLAAYGVLLERYTGQSDILVGMPIANRNRAEIERIIGFFVNTLVIRLDLTGDPSFRELVRRVRDAALGAFDHQDLPFEKLVESVQPPRSLDHSPIFQVLFLFQNAPMPTVERAGLSATHFEIPAGTGRFDLTLTVLRGTRLRFDYKRDLFDRDRMRRMLGHYQRLLEGAVEAPDRPVSELELLSAAERRQIVAAWNPPASDYPSDLRLERLFEGQVERTPEAPALLDARGQPLSFEQLNAWANRIAGRLTEAGCLPETPVGVCLERSPALVAGLLGILKAGGAWVPLDPGTPPRRAHLIAGDAGLSIALAGASPPAWLAELETPVATVDVTALATGPDPGDPGLDLSAEGLAYVLYTSGSTGRPKGVAGLHRSSVNRLQWMWRRFPFDPAEVCCQKTAVSFVDAVWEIFGPLLRGIPLVILSDDEVSDTRLLLRRLAAERVSRIVLVPSLLRAMLEIGGDRLGSELPELRFWVSSGEVLPATLAARWRRAVGESRVLLNLYGSTEVAGDSLWHRFGVGDTSTVPLGRPIDNTRCYILDDRMEPLPAGIPGDLWVGGDGLARGYVGRAARTAASFVPDPFSEEPGARLYRTGDRARYRADGVIEFEGRADLQIKLRGHRIELGEVEAVLAEHPAISASAATLAGEERDRRLVAYFVPSGPEPEPGQLRAWLASRLPSYMLPSALTALPQLPLTASGKVDRENLPEPRRLELADEGSSGPRDELERQLIDWWKELLHVDRVGRNDDFFELGGHSLLAVELLSRIEAATGKRLPLAGLVRSATVESLAESLRDHGWPPSSVSLVRIRPGGSKRPFFCVPGAGGHLLYYRELASYLDEQRPFYGLQARGLDDGHEAVDSIEEMARHYIDEIRVVQPTGPYTIGGSCFGGSVAYEMALRLTAEGESVARLVLLEAYAPLSGPAPTQLRTLIATWIRRQRLTRGRRFGAALRRVRRWLRGEPGGPVRGSLDRDVQEVIQASLHARLSYHPHGYAGRVTLLQGRDRPSGYSYPEQMGWPVLVDPPIDLHWVPGFHTGIFREPAVRELAAQLSATLDEVDADSVAS
jgi:amino acid adenylation domain-containing protein